MKTSNKKGIILSSSILPPPSFPMSVNGEGLTSQLVTPENPSPVVQTEQSESKLTEVFYLLGEGSASNSRNVLQLLCHRDRPS